MVSDNRNVFAIQTLHLRNFSLRCCEEARGYALLKLLAAGAAATAAGARLPVALLSPACRLV